MTKNQFAKHVKDLPIEKRMRITKLLHQADSAINAIECELNCTQIEHHSLLLPESPTLWVNIFRLRKLFDFENYE